MKVSIDLGSDFGAFGVPFSFLLGRFWRPFGATWGSWGRKGRPERVPEASEMGSWRQGRSRRLWGPHFEGFWEPLGASWDAFWRDVGEISMEFSLLFHVFSRLTLHPCLKRVHVHPPVRNPHCISALPVHMSRKVSISSLFLFFSLWEAL